jgi:hypothetical protein
MCTDAPQLVPKLVSLTLSHVDILYGSEEKLLDFLKGRVRLTGGLRKLVIRSCRVHEVGLESQLRDLVNSIKWDNVTAVGRDYQWSEEDS